MTRRSGTSKFIAMTNAELSGIANLDISPSKRGRPATITIAVVEQIARLIAKGMTEEQACLRVGINHSSFCTAKHRNAEFETAIKKAQADFLDESLDIIAKGRRGWQGRAWSLERCHGDQFRRNSALELSGQLTMFDPVEALIRVSYVEGHPSAIRLWRAPSFEEIDAYERGAKLQHAGDRP